MACYPGERLVGTMRRECLDFLIPVNERHLRRLLRDWVRHYNTGRPHASLGPRIPDKGRTSATRYSTCDHRLRKQSKVITRPILGGFHHEYAWQRLAA